MRTRLICLVLLTAGLTGGGFAPPAACADYIPFQSRPLALDGVITQVNGTHDRLIIRVSTGRAYALDTSKANITLFGGDRAGRAEDLALGMRVHVTGRQIPSGVTEVRQLRVLAVAPPAPTRPRGPVVPQGADAAAAAGEDIQLRGTVSTVDTRRGAFVVRVGNHTRTIYLAGGTDLSGLAQHDASRFPVKTGDRVTVAGRLQPDGGVLAGAVSLSRVVTLPVATAPQPDRVLFGRITSVGSRFTGRDIKIRLADASEIKVKVGRGLSVRRDGRGISVHELRGGDDVRVTGSYDGKDFKADRVDVLHRDDKEETTKDMPGPTRGL